VLFSAGDLGLGLLLFSEQELVFLLELGYIVVEGVKVAFQFAKLVELLPHFMQCASAVKVEMHEYSLSQ
jgi:hypothetical protein